MLALHSLASRRGAKASAARLTVQDWQAECQRITLLVHVWEKMQSAVCRDGKALFDRELLKKLKNNILEGPPGYYSLLYFTLSLLYLIIVPFQHRMTPDLDAFQGLQRRSKHHLVLHGADVVARMLFNVVRERAQGSGKDQQESNSNC